MCTIAALRVGGSRCWLRQASILSISAGSTRISMCAVLRPMPGQIGQCRACGLIIPAINLRAKSKRTSDRVCRPSGRQAGDKTPRGYPSRAARPAVEHEPYALKLDQRYCLGDTVPRIGRSAVAAFLRKPLLPACEAQRGQHVAAVLGEHRLCQFSRTVAFVPGH